MTLLDSVGAAMGGEYSRLTALSFRRVTGGVAYFFAGAGVALFCWNMMPSAAGMKISIGSRNDFCVRQLQTFGVTSLYLKISPSMPQISITAPCRLI